jgi:succinoglycan biosynthesis transport protein ExoP
VPLLIAVAACGGCILGAGIVLVREQMRRGFRNVREVAQFLSVPSIGMLPVQEPAATSRATANRFVRDHPNSPYAKNLRAISTRLLRTSKKPRGEILVVMSALPGEGKSTFAGNFALAAEASGVRTLLIDGDVYTDVKSGLHVLGARDPSTAGDDAKDIDPARLKSFLLEYGGHFDLVVIDGPSTLPLGGSTPHIECADRAVLLVEWDRTDRQAVADALDMLDTQADKLAGVVLNKVSVDWCRLFNHGSYQNSTADMKKAA